MILFLLIALILWPFIGGSKTRAFLHVSATIIFWLGVLCGGIGLLLATAGNGIDGTMFFGGVLHLILCAFVWALTKESPKLETVHLPPAPSERGTPLVNPEVVKRYVDSIQHDAPTVIVAPAAPPASRPLSSVESALRQLQGFHAAGLITIAEYEAKKKDILTRL